MKWQNQAFEKAETELEAALKKQKKQVSDAFGSLVEVGSCSLPLGGISYMFFGQSVAIYPSGVSRAKWALDKRYRRFLCLSLSQVLNEF
jgi:hypothetical protein